MLPARGAALAVTKACRVHQTPASCRCRRQWGHGLPGLTETFRSPLPAVYELEGPGSDGITKAFEKPWCMTTGGRKSSCPAGCRGGWVLVALPALIPSASSRCLTPLWDVIRSIPAVMFCGMSFCLPLAFFVERKQRQRLEKAASTSAEAAQEPLLPEGVSLDCRAYALLHVMNTLLTAAPSAVKGLKA